VQPCPAQISSENVCLTLLVQQLLGSDNARLASAGPLNYCVFSSKEMFTCLNNTVEHLGFCLCFFSGISPSIAVHSVTSLIKMQWIIIRNNISFSLDLLTVHSGCCLQASGNGTITA